MSLQEYRRKRNFQLSPEPYGDKAPASPGHRFVIQKHAATHLHYDLRLEMNGVLKSWAVPKGPSLDPSEKRLAIHVEDHPLEYLLFEGVIPPDEYGGGTVLVWDFGTWQPLKDHQDGYEKGDLKFKLDGRKLQGNWMLVHTGRRDESRKNHWLLFKERDESARPSATLDVLTEYPLSAISGRSLEDIAAAPSATWTSSDRLAMPLAVPSTQPGSLPRKPRGAKPHKAATKKEAPQQLRPALPSPTRIPPEGDQWLHEIKFDGYRMLAKLQPDPNPIVRFYSRNGHEWTSHLPRLAKLLQNTSHTSMILDGEVVYLGSDGRTNFQSLQNVIGRSDDRALSYCAFDILYLDGYDLRPVPFEDRKAILKRIVEAYDASQVLYSDYICGDGQLVFEKAAQLGAEGIVSKRSQSKYVAGRTDVWLKVKCLRSAEFIVGGYTDSTATKRSLGAMLVGRLDQEGRLIYEGRVGTGFSAKTLSDLFDRLHKLHSESDPFDALDRKDAAGVHFVDPSIVVELEYGGWTNDGRLRFPSFRGIRDDVAPQQVNLHAPVQADDAEPKAAEDGNVAAVLANCRLTHPDRVMYPEAGVTKLGLASYYAQISKWMLPHLKMRPLSLIRYPKGLAAGSFFQKSQPSGMPASVRPVKLRSDDGREHSAMVVHDVTGLMALVQFSALEIHAWGSRADRPDRPDRLVFDLDPDASVPYAKVALAAMEFRDLLAELELRSFVKTTGGNGLHVVVPIRRTITWQQAKAFSKNLAVAVAAASPGRYTVNSSKAARKGKIYLDYLRNSFGATSICNFSTRARPTASVAVPIAWGEVECLGATNAFTVENLARRLQLQTASPWDDFSGVKQTLTRQKMQAVEDLLT